MLKHSPSSLQICGLQEADRITSDEVILSRRDFTTGAHTGKHLDSLVLHIDCNVC
jgi:hypothetical protein